METPPASQTELQPELQTDPSASSGASSASPIIAATGLIAPVWHTVLVVAFLLSIAGLSAWKGAASPVGNVGERTRLLNYTVVFVWEWLTVGLIAWGLRLRGHGIRDLVGGSWPDGGAILSDIGIAALFLIGSDMILGLIRLALGATPPPAVLNLLPEGPLESVVWVVIAATAGFCEETIFRGYLQKQFTRMTRNTAAGVVLQAVIFGACHGYQGVKYIIIIGVYGGLFGILAVKRSSLRPGMITHFMQDGLVGLVTRALLKRVQAG
ncbi:MAG TPA: type II CAAX endopeptidase family protein [Candidatus Acidoferrales bacterium]|nr:type II CAAX endopeptidase family protein [Candidatus Acidoferrales bacterium]